MFRFLHGYLPKLWEAQEKAGLISENDGIRFCQNILLKDEFKFNNLAKKGGDLYNILKKRKCVFYVDRLQGGVYIDDYPYNKELLKEYKELLGENFWGFQMHEWLSNYRHDVFEKLNELPKEKWTKENIEKFIFDKYRFPNLILESMTSQEMADAGKPKDYKEFYDNMTKIYKKRQKAVGQLLPCDSYYLAYNFEVSAGAKRLMPEVGAQTPNARIQICYARGMTRKDGRSFGVYYEPWGGEPFSACCYNKDSDNEWGIGNSKDFPFETKGVNGGSSRSLQKRIFLYGYLCGAEFISEEWGLCNVFYDWKNFELSPYGQTKKEFIDFTRKYTDIGDRVTPIIAVLPKDFMVLDNLYDDDIYCGQKIKSKTISKLKQGLRQLFATSYPMLGNETDTLKNSDNPDAIDIANEDEEIISKYKYLIDLTNDDDFSKKHKNICEIKDVKNLLKKELPCYVNGNVHWLVNKCKNSGYYLSIFNHSGIERTVISGERKIKDATATAVLDIKQNLIPVKCEGDGILSNKDGIFSVIIPAGEWIFIKLANSL